MAFFRPHALKNGHNSLQLESLSVVSLFLKLVSSFGNKKIMWLYWLIIYKHSVTMQYLKFQTYSMVHSSSPVSWSINAFYSISKGSDLTISLFIHRIRKHLGYLGCHCICNNQAGVTEKVCHRINPINMGLWLKILKKN